MKQFGGRDENMECKLIGGLLDIVGIVVEEQRRPRKYNETHLLYHAEMNLIEAIHENPQANARILSEILDITQGAVTQVTGKLFKKKLIEQYTMPGNKKEKYYRLTTEGERIRRGHQEYHKEANQKLCQYFCSLSDADAKVIFDFLEKIKECMPVSEFACRSDVGCRSSVERKKE